MIVAWMEGCGLSVEEEMDVTKHKALCV
jgi:hypothetical protein